MLNGSGVYRIRNIHNGYCYIGSSIDLNKRGNHHFRELRNGTHYNILLQEAALVSGTENLMFEVLLFCEPFECTRYEQFFINVFKPKYNISRFTGSHTISTFMCRYSQKDLCKKKEKILKSTPFLQFSLCCRCGKSFPPRANGSTWFYCAACIDIIFSQEEPQPIIEAEPRKSYVSKKQRFSSSLAKLPLDLYSHIIDDQAAQELFRFYLEHGQAPIKAAQRAIKFSH